MSKSELQIWQNNTLILVPFNIVKTVEVLKSVWLKVKQKKLYNIISGSTIYTTNDTTTKSLDR